MSTPESVPTGVEVRVCTGEGGGECTKETCPGHVAWPLPSADCDAGLYQQGWEDGAEQERCSIAKELGQLDKDSERLAYVRGMVRGYRLTQEGRTIPPEGGTP